MKELEGKPVNLTSGPQTPYSRGGDIFMVQEGGENLQPSSAENSQENIREIKGESVKEQAELAKKQEASQLLKPGSGEAVKAAEDAWIKHNKERILSKEEKVMQRFLRALGKQPGEALSPEQSEEVKRRVAEFLAEPPVQDILKKRQRSETSPSQEAIAKRKGERIAPIEGLNRLSTIDTTGITDSRLKEIAATYNRKLGKGLIEYGDIDKVVRELEERLKSVGLPPDEQTWTSGTIDTLETSMMEVKQQREADQEKSERSYRERETGQKKYEIEEIISERKKRDEVFNDLFAGVDSTPHEFFDRAFNPLTYGMRYETFMDLIREASVGKLEGSERLSEPQRRELAADFIRYQTERRVRQTLHDVNAAVYIPSLTAEQLYEHMQGFSSELQDFAFREIGVKQMTDLLEESIRETMRNRDGYLDPQEIAPQPETKWEEDSGKSRTVVPVGGIEQRTKDRFRDRLKMGKITVRDNNGVSHPIKPDELQSWEVDRIFTVARGMMISTERLISLASESKLPKGSFASLFLNDIVKVTSPYHNAIGKFGVSEKDLAAYMYEQDEIAKNEKKPGSLRSLFGFLKSWSPADLEKTLKEFEGDYDKFLNNIENEDDMRYLMLRNPNRAGDIFTWLSWRMQEKPENISMSQAFLQRGERKMNRRLIVQLGKDPNFLDKLWTSHDQNLLDKKLLRLEDFKSPNNNNETMEQLKRNYLEKKYLNEYSNWLGTGLRLERRRTNLSMKEDELRELKKLDEKEEKLKKFKNPDEKEKEKKGEKADRERAEGEIILKQIVKLQPHRLYTVSDDIRKRINDRTTGRENGKLTEEQKATVSRTLDDLHLVEQALLADREKLLDRGLTFTELTLDNYYEAITDSDSTKQAERRTQAKEFAKFIKDDFANNETKYRDEFLRMKREWKHAYVLWSGDAPVDEFNATVLGPNAAVARRARDNKAQGEAVTAEVKLLMALKDAATPDQIYAMLVPIYQKVTEYDATKAKQVIAEKVEGIIKFYQADSLTNVPILGQLMKQGGVSSFAQLAYQSSRAGVWQASECNYLLDQLVSHNYIERWQYNALKAKVHATKADVAVDISSTMSQFISIALAWYLFEKLSKGEKS